MASEARVGREIDPLEHIDAHFGTACQCEHMAHFGPDTRVHRYGKVPAVLGLMTPYGRFNVCEECRSAEHMNDQRDTPPGV